jgi:septal ring factor EnvC (AmiA/AmiB activator)
LFPSDQDLQSSQKECKQVKQENNKTKEELIELAEHLNACEYKYRGNCT